MLKRLAALLLVLVFLVGCAATAQARTLRKGMRGSDVAELQTMLKQLGYYSGPPDGIFGDRTLFALKKYQKENGLRVDGLAGNVTMTALDRAVQEARKEKGEPCGGVQELLESVVKECGAACGTLVLSKDGQTILTWSFGGVSEKTCFRIASVTKWVTAIGLMTLYDQGKLDLDKDISSYLPFTVRNPAWPDTPVTARMLLNHTSSLSPDAQNYHPVWARIGKNGYDPIFNEEIQPGTAYAYADYNGALFGCLIEAITGKSVQNYLKETVFTPLGVAAAYTPRLLPKGTPTKDLLNAKGKVSISVKSDRNRPFNNKADPVQNNGYTVGKLYISTEGMTTLARMMLNGGQLNGVRILNEDTVALMEADQPGLAESRYGLGTVRVKQFEGGTWYGHQGQYSGLSSNVYYQRETGLTFALVMNGYRITTEEYIVTPAVRILQDMRAITEELCGKSE